MFFLLFCGDFTITQNVQSAVKIFNIFEMFFNRIEDWYEMMLYPVEQMDQIKSYNFLMNVIILVWQKIRILFFEMFATDVVGRAKRL